MTDVLLWLASNQEVLQALAELAAGLVGLLFAILGPWALNILRRYTHGQQEEKHLKALQAGAESWAYVAVKDGFRKANEQSVEDLRRYLTLTFPDAMKFLSPTVTGLHGMAAKALAKAFERTEA